jgi:hypothetical protein
MTASEIETFVLLAGTEEGDRLRKRDSRPVCLFLLGDGFHFAEEVVFYVRFYRS